MSNAASSEDEPVVPPLDSFEYPTDEEPDLEHQIKTPEHSPHQIVNESDGSKPFQDLTNIEPEERSQLMAEASNWSHPDIEYRRERSIPADSTEDSEKITFREQVQLIHARSYVNQVHEELSQSRFNAERASEVLQRCKENVLLIEREKLNVVEQIQAAESEGNQRAKVDRLRRQLNRLSYELDAEIQLEESLRAEFFTSVHSLNKTEVKYSNFGQLESKLVSREKLLRQQNDKIAKERDLTELKKAKTKIQALNKKKSSEQGKNDAARLRRNFLLQEARRAKAKFEPLYQASLSAAEEEREREVSQLSKERDKTVKSLLKLKKDLQVDRDTMKAVQAQAQVNEQLKTEAIREYKESLHAQGLNPEPHYLYTERLKKLKADQDNHTEKIKRGQMKIVEKLLSEQEDELRKRRLYPELYPPSEVARKFITSSDYKLVAKVAIRQKSEPVPTILQQEIDGAILQDGVDSETNVADEIQLRHEFSDDDSASGSTEPLSDEDDNTDAVDNLDSPPRRVSSVEKRVLFQAGDDEKKSTGTLLNLGMTASDGYRVEHELDELWDAQQIRTAPQSRKPTAALATAETMSGGHFHHKQDRTKAEEDILQRNLKLMRKGIVQNQVAAGRRFTGSAFYAEPKEVVFKDFELHRCYRRRVVLTNISYTINSLKFVGLSENLKDFVTVEFEPPGQISAGMQCTCYVSFRPMLLCDLIGALHFLSKTGPFDVVVRCLTKKCDISVDRSQVVFAPSVIGETLRRRITLTNAGSLATEFTVRKREPLQQPTESTVTEKSSVVGSSGISDVPASTENETAERSTAENGTMVNGSNEKSSLPPEELSEEKKDDDNEATEEDFSLIERPNDAMEMVPMAGTVAPNSSQQLEVIWKPIIAGSWSASFDVSFTDPLTSPILIEASGVSIDLPIWIDRDVVDLRICMLERLYQDCIVVNNRASSALKISFEIPTVVKDYIEVLPKTAYVQAKSCFNAQIKFLPRAGIEQVAVDFAGENVTKPSDGVSYDPLTGLIDVPMTIRVAEQTEPLVFHVLAIITGTDLEFSCKQIDFGHCTILESVYETVTLTNQSLLSQQFGFLKLPSYVQVQPNDGFGTILPHETIELQFVFEPTVAKEYEFTIELHSLIGRTFPLHCKGVAVFPPLKLSDQVVSFAATALGDASTAVITLRHDHTDANEFTHPVPRIGTGPVAPVSPMSFEFLVPGGAPFKIYPSVGTLQPGQSERIHIRYTPELDAELIRKEAVKKWSELENERIEQIYERDVARERERLKEETNKLRSKKVKGTKGSSQEIVTPEPKVERQTPKPPPAEEDILPTSPPFLQARSKLLRSFEGSLNKYSIPCFMAPGHCVELQNEAELVARHCTASNNLHLEVICPAKRPQMMIISDNGRSVLEFGETLVGRVKSRVITVQNIADTSIRLTGTLPDPCGPFEVRNSYRTLQPGESHDIQTTFSPQRSAIHHERFVVRCEYSSIYVVLKGAGLMPALRLSAEGCLDFGGVIVGEYLELPLTLFNESTLDVEYNALLDSWRRTEAKLANTNMPGAVTETNSPALEQHKNLNGQCVFDISPTHNVVKAGESTNITCTFAPDCEGDFFKDTLRLQLFGQVNIGSLEFHGLGRHHLLYIRGTDPFEKAPRHPAIKRIFDAASHPSPAVDDTVESAAANVGASGKKESPRDLLLMFKPSAEAAASSGLSGSREIQVCCMKSLVAAQKKSGEFAFEPNSELQQLGFRFDPERGSVDAGEYRNVVVSWSFPQSLEAGEAFIVTSVNIHLRSDVAETIKLFLCVLLA